MAGHSKWANIRHRKGAVDAKRAILFTKLIKEITVAAKTGGGDPETNPRLRSAIENARSNSMPKDNIERAIKKGTGDLEGVNYEEVIYEGYGPGGVAVFLECLTDNKNRTVAEIRHLFSKRGGNLGENGCVSWMFEKKGIFRIKKQNTTEENLMNIVLEVGAQDIRDEGDIWEVFCDPQDFANVSDAIEQAGIKKEGSEIQYIPENTVELNESDAEKMIKLYEALEEHDDVQKVSANFDISDDIMERLSQE